MKSILRNSVLSLVLLALVACGGVHLTSQGPGSVAVLFFSSITSGNVDDVRDNVVFANEAEEQIFDTYLERLFVPNAGKATPEGYDADFVVLSEEIVGDTAYVELKASSAVDKRVKMKVRLLNDGGKWKVDGSQAVLHRVE